MIGQTVSHYKILEKLGEGGMGVVYKAEDTRLKRTVALKFLPPELTSDPGAKARFVHEAQAASALDHPNIGVVHEIDESDDGRTFISMALYEGETLREKIRRGPLDIGETIRIALQITDGLRKAHAAGIIHRDIKPENIIITHDGLVKIVDFGLAKLSTDTHTSTKEAHVGTAAYMAPEQIQNGVTDARSDLFSVGVVLYEMVTGTRPFAGDHEAALFYSIVYNDPDPPKKRRPDTPETLDQIILRLLQKTPSRRYQTSSELYEALIHLDNHTARSSLPVKMSLRLRQRGTAVAFLAALILAATFLVILPHIWESSFKVEPADYIIVADFRNATGNPVFDHSLTEAIRVSLRQSPHLNLFPRDRIIESLRRMGTSDSEQLTEGVALGVARREGIRAVVAGDIQQAGTSFVLSCKIIDAVRGETVKLLRKQVPMIENVLSAMDGLCEDIRKDLGESVNEISGYSIQLEKVTTPSLEALELYSRGNILEGEGKYREAAVLKEEAVTKDSMFAIAVSDLSYIYRKLGNDSLALLYHSRVLPLLNRVTDREKFYILTIYFGPSFEMNYQKAFESVQQLVVEYPNSAEGYATLGHLAMFAGDFKTAVEADQKSLLIDSVYAGTVFNNMGYALALSGRVDSAFHCFIRSKQIRPTYHVIDEYIAKCYWLKGQLDSAEQFLLEVLDETDQRGRLPIYAELGSLYYFGGQFQKARRICRDAIALCMTMNQTAYEASFHFLLGKIAEDLGDVRAFRTELGRSNELSGSPFPELPLIGAEYARQGLMNEARQILLSLEKAKSADPYFVKRHADFLHLVRGEILLAERHNGEAEKEFERVQRVHSGDPFYFLAQDGIGRSQAQDSDIAAIQTLNDILDRPGEVVFGSILSVRTSGVWVRELLPEVHLRIARLLIRAGDLRRAEYHLMQCLACWQKADRQFGKMNEAQRLFAEIEKVQ